MPEAGQFTLDFNKLLHFLNWLLTNLEPLLLDNLQDFNVFEWQVEMQSKSRQSV